MKKYDNFLFEKNLRKLEKIMKIFKKEDFGTIEEPTKYASMWNYIVVLYNMLIIESIFPIVIAENKKEINSKLKLDGLDTSNNILKYFQDIMDPNHIIRYNVETFYKIDIINNFIKTIPGFYKDDKDGNRIPLKRIDGSFEYLKILKDLEKFDI